MTQTTCLRCGECCTRGGPALHLEDLELVASGRIRTRDLFTIRAGEPALDNVAGRIGPAEGEIVKIKGRESAWTCRFYDGAARACGVYDSRPLECRLLSCREPEALAAAYRRDRLSRRDLVSGSMVKLMDAHDARCSHPELARLVQELGGGAEGAAREEAAGRILAMLGYDADLRALLPARGLAPDELEFLFGRPLAEILRAYGIVAEPHEQSFRLRPADGTTI